MDGSHLATQLGTLPDWLVLRHSALRFVSRHPEFVVRGLRQHAVDLAYSGRGLDVESLRRSRKLGQVGGDAPRAIAGDFRLAAIAVPEMQLGDGLRIAGGADNFQAVGSDPAAAVADLGSELRQGFGPDADLGKLSAFDDHEIIAGPVDLGEPNKRH